METNLENLGELTRRLNVAVPLADVESEVKKRLARLAKTVKVPGFRPGHVPMKMIAQQYGPQVRSDVITDAVRRSFDDAVLEEILEKIETEEIDVDELAQRVKEAVELIKVCKDKIERAEMEVTRVVDDLEAGSQEKNSK